MTASTAWGSTECKGSPVRRSVDSGANVMLVVAPDVPIGIYGWLAPATSVLHLIVSMRANSEGVTCSPRSTHADVLFVRALGSVGIWCVGGRKGCGKKDRFKLATFPLGTRRNLPDGSAQTVSLLTSTKDQPKSKPELLKGEGSHLNQPSAPSGPNHLKT